MTTGNSVRKVAAVGALSVLALAGLGWSASASAENVFWSVGVASPGVQVAVSNAPPVVYHHPRAVVVQQPMVVHQPVIVQPAPVYHAYPVYGTVYGPVYGPQYPHGYPHARGRRVVVQRPVVVHSPVVIQRPVALAGWHRPAHQGWHRGYDGRPGQDRH